jgi:hypothetical protein
MKQGSIFINSLGQTVENAQNTTYVKYVRLLFVMSV